MSGGERGQVRYEKRGSRADVRFDHPAALNALTGPMWHQLRDAALDIAASPEVRVATFRGTGGRAFVAGTDIARFAGYATGADGVAYERDIDHCMAAVDAIPCVTVAAVEGWAVGGGLNVAAACDFRLATPEARFGSPIGRTVGNCLSAASLARIAGAVGLGVAKRMVLLGEFVEAGELLAGGFLLKVVAPDALDAELDALCGRAAENAPLTTRATKETARRLLLDGLPAIEPLIAEVYGSADFRQGVADFLARTRRVPDWTGW